MKRLFCVDLEGTLISNAVSQIPRPGLFSFLEFLRQHGDLVLYTSVSPGRTRDVQKLLVSERSAPEWFIDLDSLHPEPGKTKKYRSVAERYQSDKLEYYLIDDQFTCVDESEKDWWVLASEFLPPYRIDDFELAKVESHLLERMGNIRTQHKD
jgi:hypothetical protein